MLAPRDLPKPVVRQDGALKRMVSDFVEDVSAGAYPFGPGGEDEKHDPRSDPEPSGRSLRRNPAPSSQALRNIANAARVAANATVASLNK